MTERVPFVRHTDGVAYTVVILGKLLRKPGYYRVRWEDPNEPEAFEVHESKIRWEPRKSR